jgi:Protein of unknown function (Hypoth_ymh)
MSLTRTGEEACKSADTFERIRASRSFSRALLHPLIADKVWSAIMRGDLDGAVRTSFIAVEVAVRETGKFTPSDIGVDLMRKAFHPDKGPLTRKSDEPAEREGLMHLFSGAMLSYKSAFASVREAFRPVRGVGASYARYSPLAHCRLPPLTMLARLSNAIGAADNFGPQSRSYVRMKHMFRPPYRSPWSEWQDLNLRPPRPERGVTPSPRRGPMPKPSSASRGPCGVRNSRPPVRVCD